jgi:hypothetical protein
MLDLHIAPLALQILAKHYLTVRQAGAPIPDAATSRKIPAPTGDAIVIAAIIHGKRILQ